MSVKSKKENLKENIEAINAKMRKLELQKQIYQMQLDTLEQQPERPISEGQESKPEQE